MAQIGERIEKVDIDSDVLKAFMRTKAVEGMAGAILYTGIFEFVQKADILGNIVNQLPIIGPVRQQVNVALKDAVSTAGARWSRVHAQRRASDHQFLRTHTYLCVGIRFVKKFAEKFVKWHMVLYDVSLRA